jgi:predicted negative regulator of RcsB-dependent stress response
MVLMSIVAGMQQFQPCEESKKKFKKNLKYVLLVLILLVIVYLGHKYLPHICHINGLMQ